MRRGFSGLTGVALLALAPACSGVGGAVITSADAGAPDAAPSSSASSSPTSTSGSSGAAGGSSGASSSSSGGTTPDASSIRDAGWTPDAGGNQNTGAPADAGSPPPAPPQDGGTVVCPNDPVHGAEAVTAIASGNAVACATLTCPSGQCCYVQPSPFNVCVAE